MVVSKGTQSLLDLNHLGHQLCQLSLALDFSRPGKPTDNAFIESFNGRFRAECLDIHWFLSLPDAREKVAAWRREYNGTRPHTSLEFRSPGEYARQMGLSAIP